MGWNWITSNIAIGSEPSARSVAAMRTQGITDVLDLRGEPRALEHPNSEIYDGSGIEYHYLPMLDRGIVAPTQAQASQEYLQGIDIIRTALAKPGGKILVHCAAGISRSPSMVYAYLRTTGMSADDAWNLIKSRRTVANNQYVRFAEAAVTGGSSGGSGGGPSGVTGATSVSSTSKLVPLAIVAVGGLLIWQNARKTFAASY